MNKTRFFALAILFLQLTVCQAQEKDCVVYRWTQMDGSVSLSFTEPVYQCDYYRIRITPAEVGTDIKYLDVCSPFAKASVGDDGFFVLSQGQLITFRDQPEGLYSPGVVPMPMLGLKTPKAGCCLVVVKGMPYDYRPRVRLKDGKYSLSLRFTFNGVKPYEDVIIDVYPLGREATYSDVARRYRQYQLDRGECRPLAERVKNNPELLYAVESVEVRLRLGWKPVPSPVAEQTPETEPEMKVAIDFDRVADILDEFKRQGIDKAEFCLVGWNIGGHDGRYPQIFPVDKRLGGEEKLKALIQKAQSMGYQITCHTNSTDGYAIADTWNEDLCLVNRDGSLNHPQTTWGGGRMYNLCPQPVYERYTQSDLPRIAQLGFRGVHYIDVISTVAPRECWDKNHPLNKRQCVEYWKKILAQGQKNFGAVGSEGAFDHVVSNLDYCLYATFNDIIDLSKMPLVERTVPMCQLVYNGILLQNPCTATVNPTIKGKTAELKLQEFNGRPVFYFYSKFKSDGKSWMGDADLTCQTDEQLRESVKAVKRAYDEYRSRVALQYLFMDKHEQVAPGVFRTTFSDGTVREFKYEE
ncbi:MAG: hypothetical protein IJF84_07425 [Thermoguttaceae bacterium]|nr:hypothetical protein [Thermoguttaceae bacterium]